MREEHDRPEHGTPEEQPGDRGGTPPPDDPLAVARRARQARVAKALVALAIVVVLIVFVIANSQPVKVNFVVVTRHPRLIWVMFACAVLGGLAGYLIGKPGRQVRPPRRGEHEKPR